MTWTISMRRIQPHELADGNPHFCWGRDHDPEQHCVPGGAPTYNCASVDGDGVVMKRIEVCTAHAGRIAWKHGLQFPVGAGHA